MVPGICQAVSSGSPSIPGLQILICNGGYGHRASCSFLKALSGVFIFYFFLSAVCVSAGEGNGTHSSILAWKNPMDRGPWWITVPSIRSQRVVHDWETNTTQTFVGLRQLSDTKYLKVTKTSRNWNLEFLMEMQKVWWSEKHKEGQTHAQVNKWQTEWQLPLRWWFVSIKDFITEKSKTITLNGDLK